MPDRVFKNASLEARRLLEQRRASADAALRAAKVDNRSPNRQIELGFECAARWKGDRDAPNVPPRHGLREWVAFLAAKRDGTFRRQFRTLLTIAAELRSPMLSDRHWLAAMARLAESGDLWLRGPEEWRPRTHNAARQFSSLARHLLADYAVPVFFDVVWTGDQPTSRIERLWFSHVGRGGNLRTAQSLPIPLTKMMAHQVMAAPDDLSVPQALRWGQVRGLGGGERLARAVVGSRIGVPRNLAEQEAFWLTVVQFFVNHPMLDPHQVGPIIDYLHAQRFEPAAPRIENGVLLAGGVPPQPNLSMRGRTPQTLMRQVTEWHRRLARRPARPSDAAWTSCGIEGYHRLEGTEGNQRLFTVVELLGSRDLHDEGRVLGHCVSTYDFSCQRGRCAIFSLREDAGKGQVRRLTVEVSLPARTIVQAAGRFNRRPDPIETRLLRGWATAAGLSIAGHVMR